jgi:EPS-associated MarR family transcriptional regulator
MIEHAPKEELLYIIKEIETDPAATQRTISGKLGISLGKTNYLLRELVKKGFIKVRSFSGHSGKLHKIHYILTKRGLEEKISLTYTFLKKKEDEYNRIRQEWGEFTTSKAKDSAI